MFWLIMGSMAAAGIRWGAKEVYANIANSLGWISNKQLHEIEDRNKIEKNVIDEILGMPPFMGNILSVMTMRGSGVPLVDVVSRELASIQGASSGVVNGREVKASRGIIDSLSGAASLLGVGGAPFFGRMIRMSLYGKRDVAPGRSRGRGRRR
jgi:hypothetical protein